MHRDIERPRFSTYEEFLEYAEGATVAPTTIYLFLVASRSAGDSGSYQLPEGFDLFGCGRELGLFAYLAHIMRDLAQDLATGKEGLLYFAADDMERHGVTEAMLFTDLERRQASPQIRALIAELGARARASLAAGRVLMQPLAGVLTADCAFILDLIVTLYERVVEKLAACSHDPLAGNHLLSSADKQQIVFELKKRRRRPA
jgi:phytoene synthase